MRCNIKIKHILSSLIMSKSFFQTVTRNSWPLFSSVKLQILPSSGFSCQVWRTLLLLLIKI